MNVPVWERRGVSPGVIVSSCYKAAGDNMLLPGALESNTQLHLTLSRGKKEKNSKEPAPQFFLLVLNLLGRSQHNLPHPN